MRQNSVGDFKRKFYLLNVCAARLYSKQHLNGSCRSAAGRLFQLSRHFKTTMLTVKMRGRKNHRMFSRRQSVNAPLFARVLMTLLIGAFLSACHPRVGDFVAPYLPDRDSKLFHGAGFLVEVIAGRSLKSADFPSRLWAGKTRDDFHVQ